MNQPWIGVDLDGTLAFYDGWKGAQHIGNPIPEMVERVRAWLAAGKEVRIFTARVAEAFDGRDMGEVYDRIHKFSRDNFGQALPITCTKDHGMTELWDDRAVRVVKNTGQIDNNFAG